MDFLGFAYHGGHFLNDMCWSMEEFVKPDGEVRMDMMDILPCVSAKAAVDTIGMLRNSIWKKHTKRTKSSSITIHRELPLLCQEYVAVSVNETCGQKKICPNKLRQNSMLSERCGPVEQRHRCQRLLLLSKKVAFIQTVLGITILVLVDTWLMRLTLNACMPVK